MSKPVSIGNYAGKSVFTFNWPGSGAQDTGPLLYQEGTGYQRWLFHLLVQYNAAASQGYAVTLFGTTDKATAAGTAATPFWFPIPGTITEAQFAWANPLTDSMPACYVQCGLVAVRAVSSQAVNGTNPTGTAILNVYAFP